MVVRAPEGDAAGFRDPVGGGFFPVAEIRWGDGVGPGYEFRPDSTLASLIYGDVELEFGPEVFGVVVRLLVEDGGSVAPGDPIVEIEQRPPTVAEWGAERDRATVAEARARQAEARRGLLRRLFG